MVTNRIAPTRGAYVPPTLTPDAQPPRLWTSAQVWTYLNIHEATLRRWLRNGRITGHKIGGRWRFEPEEVIRLVREEKKGEDDGRAHPDEPTATPHPSHHAKTGG